MLVGKCDAVNERRLWWITYHNLKILFKNWKKELVELGFIDIDKQGEIFTKKENMKEILNLNKTCTSMGGRQGERGGCPSFVC